MGLYKGTTKIAGSQKVDVAIEHTSANAIANSAVAYALDQKQNNLTFENAGDNISITDVSGVTKINCTLSPNDIFDMIYPVGSVYVSLTNTLPSIFSGTWERITDEYYLVSASENQGDYVDAELPNIKGGLESARNKTNFGQIGTIPGITVAENPFYTESVSGSTSCVAAVTETGNYRVKFDLSRYDATYKDGGKVQPKSLKCSMWKRTA